MARWWRRWLGRRFGEDAETVRVRYARFQHLITANSRVLDLFADAGEKTGGDYLFDQRYLDGLASALEQAVESVVYDLNAMSDGRYLDLVDAFERIRRQVRAILSPADSAQSELVLPLERIDFDSAEAVGEKMASLGEIGNRIHLPVPGGFVITAAACQRHFRSGGLEPLIVAQSEILQRQGCGRIQEVSERLQEAIRTAPIDPEVQKTLKTELKKPERSDWMYAVRSSALGEDGMHSFAGQHATLLNVPPTEAENAYREVLASLFSPGALRYRFDKGLSMADALMPVGFLAMVEARWSGVIHTVDPAAPERNIMVVSAAPGLGPTVVEGTAPVDRYELTRDPTPWIVSRRIVAKDSALLPRDKGGTEVSPLSEPGPSLSDGRLTELARLSFQIERHAGHHQEIEFAIDADGRVVVLQTRTLRVEPAFVREEEEHTHAVGDRPALLRGKGVIACRGVGAGPVVVVRSSEDFHEFPHRGVLVAQNTSPRYSPLLTRASAVVTKVGSSTGHLAVVAREFRIPMIVDVGEAVDVLQPGMDVTVDAEENVIYAGIAHDLLLYSLSRERTDAEFEEFRLLRRLMRKFTPLNLSDPDSESFRARFCTTYHDVVRFAHEMAVRELVDLPGLSTRDRRRFVRRLRLNIPMDLDVLDIGGGLADGDPEGLTTKDQVKSAPLSALLEGLCAPGTWRTEPVDMDMESFLSSATRAATFATTDTKSVRPNLAVVSENYLNLHLLLGYHFNMVDCHLSDIPTANYIYFRFTGGVTDITRRSRRARVIAAILDEYEFGVETKGDLVIGRLREGEPEKIREKLEMIGRLIGYTRQLDVLLRDESTVREHAREFIGHELFAKEELLYPENQEGT